MALGVALAATAPASNELTVYNQGFGLVKEVRTIDLKAGRQTVAVEDVASMIEPASVSIHSLTDADSFEVLEQNYQFDLISPIAILNKSVGNRVRFVRTLGTQRDVLEGTLISAPTAIVGTPEGGSVHTYNGMVIRTDDGRIVLNPTGEIEVTEVPKGLISKPTLLWDLESKKAGPNHIELSYISRGMKWEADYVLTLLESSKADVQGWVTIDHQSGGTWEDAKLKLLAGDVQRARPAAPEMDAIALGSQMRKGAGGGFQEESLFEYHLYTLQRPATIRNKEIKQLSLLEGRNVPVVKRIIVDATRQFGRFFPGEGEIGTGDIKPQVRVEFVNDQKSGMGMPLPRGRVKVYQRDKSGSVQLLGEDNIDHTPRDEKVSLVVGRSFDIRATRKRTEFRRITDRSVQETFEIEVRNRKDSAETVTVIERFWGDWTIQKKSQEFVKEDSTTAVFTVRLDPNET
ncbi:MAG TPA: hypothetical protein VGE01_00880, partial [Fimbriimonas sp.]